MNTRIQELAEQAFAPINDMASEGIADRSTFNMHWFRLYNQKFAELIVRECAELSVNSQYVNTKSEYYEGFNEASIYVGNKIKKHFGIEE